MREVQLRTYAKAEGLSWQWFVTAVSFLRRVRSLYWSDLEQAVKKC